MIEKRSSGVRSAAVYLFFFEGVCVCVVVVPPPSFVYNVNHLFQF